MMKKILLASLLCSCCLIPAAQSFAQQQEVKLRMSWWGGKTRHDVMLRAIDAFEKRYPWIEVNAEYTGWDGYLARMTTQISGNKEPDVMQINWPWLPIFSRTGEGFYDLNKVSDTLDLSQFPTSDLQSTTVKGKLTALPISLNVPGFYFNNETWKKAGLAYPTNWDELFASGKTFKEKLGDDYYPLIANDQDIFLMTNCYMSQKYNLPMFTADGKSFSWNQEQWREAFRFAQRLVADHVIPGPKMLASYGKQDFTDTRYWQQGQWAGAYTWNVVIQYYTHKVAPPAKLEPGNWIMAPGATNASAYFKVSLTYAIGKNTQHPKEAAMLLNFLLNDPQAVEFIKLENGIPISQAAVKTLTDNGTLTNDNPSVAGMAMAKKLQSESVATSWMEDEQIQALWSSGRQNMDYGKKTANEAADEFLMRAERILKKAAMRR
ncbi:ABC transporter substrate-binding protein [Pseudocitrobacter sp. 73]|uniref:ABC transporter substrate-binding protein n=1 Tax=Pseudocitrobacter sp. 73 TaxID=2605731 RepID=UPI002104CAC5|nr:ABC transporter substrate-binding protein [Pseudocitrobacter sp. 73]